MDVRGLHKWLVVFCLLSVLCFLFYLRLDGSISTVIAAHSTGLSQVWQITRLSNATTLDDDDGSSDDDDVDGNYKDQHNSTSLPVSGRQELARWSNNIVYVNSRGNLTERIRALNVALQSVRDSLDIPRLKHQSIQTREIIGKKRRRIVVSDDAYVNSLGPYRQIRTVALPWSSSAAVGKTWSSLYDYSNLLIQRYYRLHGSEFMCDWLRSKAKERQAIRLVFRKVKCTKFGGDDVHSNVSTSRATSLEFGHMKANNGMSFPREFYATPPPLLTHIHVIAGGVVVKGDSRVIAGNMSFVFDYCLRNHGFNRQSSLVPTSVPSYDELFAMRHLAGAAVYHGMAEEIPRIAPFVEFLQRNPQIRIHVSAGQRPLDFLRVLGLEASRAVAAKVVRAKVAYVPRAPSCMMPRLTETQLLAAALGRYISRQFPPQPRNTVILINRSKRRRFVAMDTVKQLVENAALKHGFKLAIFADNPLPSFNDTMQLFHSAVMVIGVLGAGLTNVLFCRPGTYVVEIIPTDAGSPLCYLQLAHVLGHQWHGVPGARQPLGEISFSLNTLTNVVENYLRKPMPL